jgi:putative DNA primase/helicase
MENTKENNGLEDNGGEFGDGGDGIGKADDLGEIVESGAIDDAILRKIAATVEKRAAVLQVPPEKVDIDECELARMLAANERGDGCLYAARNRGRYMVKRFAGKEPIWLKWDGRVWVEDRRQEHLNGVELAALDYESAAIALQGEISENNITKTTGTGNEKRSHPEAWKIKRRDNYRGRAQKLRSLHGMKKTAELAYVVDPELSADEEDYDQRPMLLPANNGVIDLTTGTMTAAKPGDLLTRRLDVDYNPRADKTAWEQFILDITGDADVAAFIKRTFGYACTGHSHEQFLWFFIGPGRNGKSLMFNSLYEVMKPYYLNASPGMLISQKHEPPPSATSEHIYSVMGMRIVVSPETKPGQVIDTRMVKQLTGSDLITCRPNFRSEIQFRPALTLFLQTNHAPRGLAGEWAMSQRLLKVEFPFMYVDDPAAEAEKNPMRADFFKKKDKNLKDKLLANREGILRWLVEGCLEWQREGISPPSKVLRWVDEMVRIEDYLGEFIRDCLVAGEKIPLKEVHRALVWWWDENQGGAKQYIPTIKTIKQAFFDRGYRVEKKGGRNLIYDFSLNLETYHSINTYRHDEGP